MESKESKKRQADTTQIVLNCRRKHSFHVRSSISRLRHIEINEPMVLFQFDHSRRMG